MTIQLRWPSKGSSWRNFSCHSGCEEAVKVDINNRKPSKASRRGNGEGWVAFIWLGQGCSNKLVLLREVFTEQGLAALRPRRGEAPAARISIQHPARGLF